ncbi:MAG: 2-oxo acid dehydrogenase subunit E2 [Candidatus Carbobacillus altaicus]|nr:2-oxo acid dehydrogenase subunit E2 [Candidatus Carbobacillus altaicus]
MGRVKFPLPELGEGIHEGEIVKWLVQVGDTVEEDTPLVEVQNDKAVVEIPSPYAGKVLTHFVREGETVTVGEPLVELEVAESNTDATAQDELSQAVEQTIKDQKASAKKDDKRVLAMPSVRKFAREQGVDLKDVRGSGPHGRILRKDVEMVLVERQKAETLRAAHAAGSEKAPEEAVSEEVQDVRREEAAPSRLRERSREPLIGTRRLIAQAMVRSVQTAPHVTLMDDVDVSALIGLRARFKEEAEKRAVKLTYLPFIMKAVAGALKAHPYLNAMLDDERQEIVTYANIHLGVAVDAPRGLVVPVVRDVERLSIWEMARVLQDLIKRAREGKLKADEFKDGTFSISNIGSEGGSFFTPIINHPQVAILGVGRIKEAPIVIDHALSVGQVLPLSLSFDHRVVDGALGQAFLNHIKRMLADPLTMLMES